MVVAVVLLWLAALSAYLSSKQQVLLDVRFSKLTGWGLFTGFSFFGWLFMMGVYSGLTSFLIGMSYIMAAWISTIFFLGHYRVSLWQFGLGGALVSLVVFYLGDW